MPMLANVLLRTPGKNQSLIAATDPNLGVPAAVVQARACAERTDSVP
jgi:hypothetical protein